MISIIFFLQSCIAFFLCDFVYFRYLFHFRVEILMYLPQRYATHRGITVVHRDVVQIVQVAEDADLAEFRHPREESEAEVAVLRLEYGIEGLECLSEQVLKGLVVDGQQKRLVVFVDEEHHLPSCLLVCQTHDMLEALFHTAVFVFVAIFLLPLLEMLLQHVVQRLRVVVGRHVQVEKQDGVFCPFMLHLLDGQSFEQLPLTLEVRTEHGYKQTFSKPAGTAQKIILTLIRQLIGVCRLVDIAEAVFTDILK